MFHPLSRVTTRDKRFHPLHALFAALLLVVLPASVHAQGGIDYTGTGGRHTIQGRIYFPSGRRADVLSVKVKLENTSTGGITVFADPNGSFSFKNLTGGSYTVVIEAGPEYEVVRESIYIEDMRSRGGRGGGLSAGSPARVYTVPIYLMPKRVNVPNPKPGVLNAALANVPKPALELYIKATESVRKGDSKKAVEQLTSAIALHPDFGLALNELGVQYLKLSQADKAADVLRSALKITPDDFAPRLNYGIALLNKKEYAEAETQLRQALKKNDASPTAHMYLGMALLSQRKNDEAEAELRRAVSTGKTEVSVAHKYLGGLYWSKREYKRAADELEKYLQLAPKAPDAEKLRGTIKELRSKQ